MKPPEGSCARFCRQRGKDGTPSQPAPLPPPLPACPLSYSTGAPRSGFSTLPSLLHAPPSAPCGHALIYTPAFFLASRPPPLASWLQLVRTVARPRTSVPSAAQPAGCSRLHSALRRTLLSARRAWPRCLAHRLPQRGPPPAKMMVSNVSNTTALALGYTGGGVLALCLIPQVCGRRFAAAARRCFPLLPPAAASRWLRPPLLPPAAVFCIFNTATPNPTYTLLHPFSSPMCCCKHAEPLPRSRSHTRSHIPIPLPSHPFLQALAHLATPLPAHPFPRLFTPLSQIVLTPTPLPQIAKIVTTRSTQDIALSWALLYILGLGLTVRTNMMHTHDRNLCACMLSQRNQPTSTNR